MNKKKDFQQTILGSQKVNDKSTEEEFFGVLKSIAPGTNIRTALEGILKVGKGAIIAIENDYLSHLIDGGFRINARFTPQRLIELSKMDGAMILSKDMKRIILANALLTPDSKISTHETGTRHKAAERVAKQSATLVIAASERRKEITVYYKDIRYPMMATSELLRKANEHIQMVEKQRELFDKHLQKLNRLELRNYPSLDVAVQVIQKAKIFQKISSDLKKYIIELGKEGTLLKSRLKEITSDVDKECDLVIKDYTQLDVKKTRALLDAFTYEDLLDKNSVLKTMNYENSVQHGPIKGWRILSKTPLLEQEIAAIIKEAGSLGKAIYASSDLFKTVIGEEKTKIFKSEIENIKMNF